MNRADRRKMGKLGFVAQNEPIYHLTASDIAKIKEESAATATETAVVMLLSIPIKVMSEKYGWGMKKRLPELANAIIDEYQRFVDSEVTLEKYQQLVYNTCGLKFQRNTEV